MKAVFALLVDSDYDDDIENRYHFPVIQHYQDVALASVGDWIVYRESRRNKGRQAYIGTAQVIAVEPDPNDPIKKAYARVANFIPFSALVPLRGGGRYAEETIRKLPDKKSVGPSLRGNSVRPLAQEDFDAIVLSGLSETLDPQNAARLGLDFPVDGLLQPGLPPGLEDRPRRIEQMLINRNIRDANFRLMVCEAYENRCAVTGLRIVNGGGRAEVQAAHIQPVADGGPDIVQNGIALSATVHWLFDRHLISLGEDYRLLVSHNRVPSELTNLFRPSHEPIHLPKNPRLHPHPRFLAHHREHYANSGH